VALRESIARWIFIRRVVRAEDFANKFDAWSGGWLVAPTV